MNQILEWLSGGDLRSDGLSNEAADFVLQHPELLGDLFQGIDEADDVVRGRTADALEKVARTRPDLLVGHLGKLVSVAATDAVPMVKMHIAMILGHLATYEDHVGPLTAVLLYLLEDDSPFVVSWAIVSLCIIGRMYPRERSSVIGPIAQLQGSGSVAVRSKVRNALRLLTHEGTAFPKGWIKSEHLQTIGGRQSNHATCGK